ncbi:trypsin-like serine peptidase [Streptomyces sp. NPDC001530]|uniref:trypsin-like serine peptidase n=1 Tax=Streptomyces sp. NPDC001530 TaxID=3364582 RepID=UPI003693B583
MRLLHAVTLAATTAALSLTPLTAQAGTGPDQHIPADISVSVEKRTDREIRAHWTPERLRAAAEHPAKMPVLKKKHTARAEDTAPAGEQSAHASAHSVKPVNSTLLTTAAAPTEISVSQEVPYTTAPQYSLVGRLFYDQPDGSGHSCTAAVIVSNNRNTLWTAGHCVHMGDGSGDAGWMQNMYFIPGYRDGSGPYGAWTVKSKVVNNEWMDSSDMEDADYAAVVLNDHPTWGKLQDNVGAFGYTFTENLTDHSDVYDAGYPGEGYNRTDLNAERMMYCYGNTVDAGPWNPFDDRMSMDCDMGKGSSGGPMIEGKSSTDPRIIGANSHYQTDDAGNRNSDDLFSSEHDSKAGNTMSAANAIG